MIASAQTLRQLRPLTPFVERTRHNGVTHGLSSAGYDVRIREAVTIGPGEFKLASTLEYFDMPTNLLGIVHDKSTWGRRGLAVQNTVIEPGWRGFLTIELSNHNSTHSSWWWWSKDAIHIPEGTAIAQIVFHILDKPTIKPYEGKYQDQPGHVVQAIFEK